MTGAVGIDLGTTSSALAITKDGQPAVITTNEGKRMPSVVAVGKNGEWLIGHAARKQAALNPENTVFSIKRLLGRGRDDPETPLESARLPFHLTVDQKGNVQIYLPNEEAEYSPQALAGAILKKLKQEAEICLGRPVTEAVLTVPAYFNERQRMAVKEAGRIAGLDVLRIINEPTAAALAYGLQKNDDETILVVDLGGGTYDVSVLEIDDGSVTVKASRGDTFLGGEDWDAAIIDWILNEFLRRHGVDLSKNRRALQRVREAAEQAKIELSTRASTAIRLPFVTSDTKGTKHLHMDLTRSRFQKLTAPLRERLIAPIRETLDEAGIAGEALDEVILVGGASRMPCVRDTVRRLTGKEASADVDPEEVVALGAALQAGLLSGDVYDVRLRDATPLSLGLETMGGLMTTIIPRNTSLPARRTEVFSTMEDEQTAVEIHVLQGERQMAADNSKLGVINLDGIPPAPRGVPQIEVTFEIDVDGILHVSARDTASDTGQTLSVTSCTALPDEEVQRIVREAERHAAEDLRQRALVEARNVARQTIYQTQRTLDHVNGHVTNDACREKRQDVMRKITALQSALEGGEEDKIRNLTADVQEATAHLNRLTYEQHYEGSLLEELHDTDELGRADNDITIDPL